MSSFARSRADNNNSGVTLARNLTSTWFSFSTLRYTIAAYAFAEASQNPINLAALGEELRFTHRGMVMVRAH